MKVSVIIPTYEGAKTLKYCLNSILYQTVKPLEVIIVDDSVTDDVRQLVYEVKDKFKEEGIELVYLNRRNKKYRSAARARNEGAKVARGDILLFVDDDVILNKRYLESVLEVFRTKSKALGVQGLITNFPEPSPLKRAFCKVFRLGTSEPDRSGWLIYPYPLTKVIRCCWLSGSNMAVRREVFKFLKFDENLLFYSYGEDILFSWTLSSLGGRLYATPKAKVFLINRSVRESLNPKARELILTAYRAYLWIRIKRSGLRSLVELTWSLLGWLLAGLIESFRKRGVFPWRLRATMLVLKELKELTNLRLDALNGIICEDMVWFKDEDGNSEGIF